MDQARDSPRRARRDRAPAPANAPGRYDCSTTSASRTRSRNAARPASLRRSRYRKALPTFRSRSRPRIVGSNGERTIVTSAPYPASTRPALGPAMMRVRSRTRTPDNGRVARQSSRSGSARAPDSAASARSAATPPEPPASAAKTPSPASGAIATTGRPATTALCGCASHSSRVRIAAATPPASAIASSSSNRPRRRTAASTAARSCGTPSTRHAISRMVLEVAVQPHPAVGGLVVAGQRRPVERGLAVHAQIPLAPEGDRRLPHADHHLRHRPAGRCAPRRTPRPACAPPTPPTPRTPRPGRPTADTDLLMDTDHP